MGNPQKGKKGPGGPEGKQNDSGKSEDKTNIGAELLTKEEFAKEAERVNVLFETVDTTLSSLANASAEDVKKMYGKLDEMEKGIKAVIDDFNASLENAVKAAESGDGEGTGAPGIIPQFTGKSLGNTDSEDAEENVPDIEFFGDGDAFKLICKASSQEEGWMKSTKALQIDGLGCLIQVTTQQRNLDGSYAVAEALTFVKDAKIEEPSMGGNSAVNRTLVK